MPIQLNCNFRISCTCWTAESISGFTEEECTHTSVFGMLAKYIMFHVITLNAYGNELKYSYDLELLT